MDLGIDRIGAWPGTLSLDVGALAEARGADPDAVRAAYLADERAVLAPWEDPVTLAVNAARSALDPEDLERVELLLVASETSVDREKPLSTWVHRYLGLRPDCRNLEVKHACYGATGALSLALAWLASPLWRGGKVLVINTDNGLLGIGQPYEYVLGAGAAAVLVARDPALLRIEHQWTGVHANEITDVMRPTARIETGNGEASLYSYLEALAGAWDRYAAAAAPADLDAHFAQQVFHMPFAGMAQRAHRSWLGLNGRYGKADVADHFSRCTLPSLRYTRRLGGTYGASTFLGLLGALDTPGALAAGDRVGVFAFGAGSCAEFYSGIVASGAHEAARRVDAASLLGRRLGVSVPEYEAAERERHESIGVPHYAPTRDGLQSAYRERIEGSGQLILEGVQDYVRVYGWA